MRRRSRSSSSKDDTKRKRSPIRKRSRSRLPSSVASSLLMPIPSSTYRELTRTFDPILDSLSMIERLGLDKDELKKLSSIQRTGLNPLFDTNILLDIGDYHSNFPFTNEDVKVEYTTLIDIKQPIGIATIYDDIAVSSNKEIKVFSKDGKYKYNIGDDIVSNPSGLCFDNKRNLLFVTDIGRNQVHIFSSDDNKDWSFVYSIGSEGKANGQFNCPYDVAVTNNEFVVCDYGNDRLQFFNITSGTFIRSVGTKGSGASQFEYPSGMCFDSSSDLLYIADQINHRVCVLSARDGSFIYSFSNRGKGGEQLYRPFDVCVSDDGQFIVVADFGNHRVQILRADDGSFVASYGSYGRGEGQFFHPISICLSNEDDLLVCDYLNNRVVCIHAI